MSFDTVNVTVDLKNDSSLDLTDMALHKYYQIWLNHPNQQCEIGEISLFHCGNLSCDDCSFNTEQFGHERNLCVNAELNLIEYMKRNHLNPERFI